MTNFKYTTLFRTLQEVIIILLSLGGWVYDPSETIEHMMLLCKCSFVMQTSHMHHKRHIKFGLGHAQQQVPQGFCKIWVWSKKSNSLIGGTCPHLLIFMKSASSSELLDSWLWTLFHHTLSSSPALPPSFFTWPTAVLWRPPRVSIATGKKVNPWLLQASAVSLIFPLEGLQNLILDIAAVGVNIYTPHIISRMFTGTRL